MSISYRYKLAPGVRVRKEKFGLLFYSSKNSKLTLVHSGDWIEAEYFQDQQSPRICGGRSLSEEKLFVIEERLSKLLFKLVEKGLIVETVADP